MLSRRRLSGGVCFAVMTLATLHTEGATYNLELLAKGGGIIEGPNVDSIPGLHVGSMLAFKADCINVDIQGIEDSRGTSTGVYVSA